MFNKKGLKRLGDRAYLTPYGVVIKYYPYNFPKNVHDIVGIKNDKFAIPFYADEEHHILLSKYQEGEELVKYIKSKDGIRPVFTSKFVANPTVDSFLGDINNLYKSCDQLSEESIILRDAEPYNCVFGKDGFKFFDTDFYEKVGKNEHFSFNLNSYNIMEVNSCLFGSIVYGNDKLWCGIIDLFKENNLIDLYKQTVKAPNSNDNKTFKEFLMNLRTILENDTGVKINTIDELRKEARVRTKS